MNATGEELHLATCWEAGQNRAVERLDEHGLQQMPFKLGQIVDNRCIKLVSVEQNVSKRSEVR
jgi:hypothetical protein